MSASISDLQLESLDEDTKEPPVTRIKNAAEGRKCFHTMQQQDSARGLQRTRHQALLDGEPPLDQSLLIAKGRSSQTNVNWGDARSVMDGVETGLIDMNVSVETLVYVPLIKQAVPDDDLRFNYENILSEESSKTIRGWEEYDRSYLNLGRVTFWHGVGIGYFEDHLDWRFETTGLGDFVIPNGTKASENRIPVAACLRYMELHELYGYIRDEEMAAKMGWNVKAVQQAILHATPEHRGTAWSQNNWMKVQQELRSNDIGMSIAGRTAKVGVIHEWVQEFDGTVSKYIAALTPCGETGKEDDEKWLYHQPNIYPEMRRGMVFFTYSIGEHGTYHSISGLGRRIFPQGNTLNRAMCTMLDAAITGSGIFMQPESEASMSKMTLVPIGGGLTLLPAKEHGQMILRPLPDLSHGIQPIIQDMRDTMGRRAGQFQGSDSPFNTAVEKTRFEVSAQLEALGKVGATQINMWYAPWSRLLRESVRRMCRPDYQPSQPGGKEVADFHRRLQLRGFPLELLAAIDHDSVRAERAVGSGSGSSRIGRLTQLREFAGELGETGRRRLNRDLIAATLDGDYDQANRYMERDPEPLPTIDAQFAAMENMMVSLGQDPQIIEGQMPLVHLQVHLPALAQLVQAANESEEAMIEGAEKMLILHSHCVDTLETVQDSKIMEQQVAQYRQILQQFGEIVQNSVRKAIAHAQDMAEQEGQADGQGGQDALMMQKLAEAQVKLDSIRNQANLKLQIKDEEHQQKLAHKAQEFRQKAALDDAKTSGQMIHDARRADMERQNQEAIAKIKRDQQAAKPTPKNPTDKK
jgi:hypothetical protein